MNPPRFLILATLPALLTLAACGDATSATGAEATANAPLSAGSAIEPTDDPIQAQSRAAAAEAANPTDIAEPEKPPMGAYAITSEPAPPPTTDASGAPLPFDPTKD